MHMQLKLEAPSPEETTTVTPRIESMIAAVLNASKVDVLMDCSTAPHDIELDKGGLGSSETSSIHAKKGSSV